jgi:acetyltransferase-like isoleucine patch superfamily enzyme
MEVMMNIYSEEELKNIGFKSIGNNVRISKKASIYSPNLISIGSNVRIDDFCVLSGEISIGSNIHIAVYSGLFGGREGIFIEDYSNISSKVTIYAISDDYSGETMTNPTIPEKYKNVQEEKVIIEKHVIIGSGCVVLPGVRLKEGSAFGAMSLINKSVTSWSINAGIPIRKIKNRSKNLLNLEREFLNEVR